MIRDPALGGPEFAPRSTIDFELAGAPVFPDGSDIVDACVRLRGEPLGVVAASMARGLPALLEEVADRLARQLADAIVRQSIGQPRAADPIAAAFETATASGDDATDVSVVLCTRDRNDDLAAALRGLVDSRNGQEIVVVDNSADGTAAPIVARYPSVRYVTEPRPGLDHARNRGVAQSTRQIVAFTDDDARADPRWALEIARFFAANPDASALTGLVLPLGLETEAQARFESYLGFGRGFAPRWSWAPEAGRAPIAARYGNTGRLGTGANMAFRRTALDAVGGFHPGLDAGTRTAGGGDLEVLFRILKAGGLVAYRPSVLVRHRHRRTLEGLSEQIESWGTGMGAYLESVTRSFPEEIEAVRDLRRRLLATWFAPRWARSLVLDRARHDLVRREVRGLRLGRELLDVSGQADPRGFRRIHAAAPRTPAVVAVVEICEPIGPIEATPGTAHARIFVRRAGQPVGRMELPVIGAAIGQDRLREAIADRYGVAVLGMSHGAAIRRIRQVLPSLIRVA
jgi:glycosyltransferase involved in cell wall biosynthesis